MTRQQWRSGAELAGLLVGLWAACLAGLWAVWQVLQLDWHLPGVLAVLLVAALGGLAYALVVLLREREAHQQDRDGWDLAEELHRAGTAAQRVRANAAEATLRARDQQHQETVAALQLNLEQAVGARRVAEAVAFGQDAAA